MKLTHKRALDLLRLRRTGRALAPATVRLEQRLLSRLLPRLTRPLGEVGHQDLERLLAARRDEVSGGTVARELAALRALFAVLTEEGLLDEDPTTKLSFKAETPPQLLLGDESVRRLLAAASEQVRARRPEPVLRAISLRNRAALELLFALGLRASELCESRVVDLDLTDRSMLVRRVKRGPASRLPLPGRCAEHLDAYLRKGRPVLLRLRDESEGRLVVNERGRRLTVTHLERLVDRIAARAGLRAHPHALRRSLASGLVRNGASLPAVQALLGHQSLDTTQRYVGVDLEELRACVELIGQVVEVG